MFVFSSISFGTVTCSSVSQYQAVWEADSSSDVASCVFYYGTSDVGVGQGTGAGAGPRKLKAGVGFIFEIFTFLASIALVVLSKMQQQGGSAATPGSNKLLPQNQQPAAAL